VLVLFEACGGGYDHITPALTGLGLYAGATITLDVASFSAQLSTATWDLVVVDEYGNNIDEATMSLLSAHVTAGRPLIFASWELYSYHPGTALLTQAGVTLSGDYSTVLPIYRWALDPLFTTPNAVPDLVPTFDACGIDGQYGEATTATAAAGFTTADAPNQTALTISADSRIILNLFMPQTISQDADLDGVQDMVELYENEIDYLL
jgi:hypothetical protein